MATERIVSGKTHSPAEEAVNLSLRPTLLDDYVGQPRLVEKLRITLQAVKERNEPMEHVLLHGPPGLGKTTLAHVIANEMDAHLTVTSGPALTKPGDLVGFLTKLQRGDVLFIDEVHRMPVSLEEYLYSAMEDFKIDVTVDQGMHAKTITLPLQPFTLIGATTRAGLISGPMRSRFGLTHNLEFYPQDDLLSILHRSAGLLDMTPTPAPGISPAPGSIPGSSHDKNPGTPPRSPKADPEPREGSGSSSSSGSPGPPESPNLTHSLAAIASRSRGTPRIANRLLRRIRDFAQVRHDGQLDPNIVNEALKLEGVDDLGLDELDRKYLRVIADTYEGGPVGVEAIAATLGEDAGTLEEVCEPYLLQIGFLARTRKGRQLTKSAAEHLGVTIAINEPENDLFE